MGNNAKTTERSFLKSFSVNLIIVRVICEFWIKAKLILQLIDFII